MAGDAYHQDLLADFVAGELVARLQSATESNAITLQEFSALTVTHTAECPHWQGNQCACGRVLAVVGPRTRVEVRIDGSIHRVTCQ